ncbi:hypothetical protein [Spirosoma pulveris]
MTVGLFGKIYAQTEAEFYQQSSRVNSGIGFRVGINYSVPAVTAAVVPTSNSLSTSYLEGVESKFGYYIGGYLYKNIARDQLILRLDATMQMKALRAAYNNKTVANPTYYYLGVTPLIGLHLTNRLIVYTGPEINLQVARQTVWGKGAPLEVGTALRLTYKISRFALEVGYFRGFTKIDRFEIYNLPGGPGINDIYNQNVQIGLTYQKSR